MPCIALFKMDGTAADRSYVRRELAAETRAALFANASAPRSATIMVGIDEPRALNLYREGDDFSPPFDLAIKADYRVKEAMLENLALSGLLKRFPVASVFTTEETTKKKPVASLPEGELPGVHMLHPLRFHRDLSRSALLRSWRDVHGDLAVTAHSGADYYSQQLVTDVPVGGAAGIGGFSEFHFPSMQALIDGYFANDEARRAIRHDIRHFVDGIPPRLFAVAYTYAS